MRRPFLAAVVAASLIGPPLAASAANGLTVGPNVNVSRMVGNQAETSIAINPTNPDNIVVASNIQFGGQLFEAYTFNGGATWKTQQLVDGDNLGLGCCDPSLAFDSYGNLFFIFLNRKANDVVVTLSTDGGKNFEYLGPVERTDSGKGHKLPHKGGWPVDQPTVTTGPGSVWVTYKDFAHNQLIRAAGAPVSGLGDVGKFSKPQGAPGSRPGYASFGDIAVGADGQVLVTYQDNIPSEGPSNIFVNLDPDGLGPAGFGDAIRVTKTNVGGFDYIPPQALRSVDAETGLAWDRTGGANDGRVYMVYTGEKPDESDDTNIFVRYSDDDGKSWSGPVRVNDDDGVNSQFNPHISLDPTTGYVAVSFYDARNDLGQGGEGDTNGLPNDDAQYWATVSRDGGASFAANVRVSEGTSNAQVSENGVQYGDYLGMAFHGGEIHPAWADNSNSTGDNPDGTLYKFDIYTATITVR